MPAPRDRAASRARLAGHYRLVSSTEHDGGGIPVRRAISGQTYYDGKGRMWVLLVPRVSASESTKRPAREPRSREARAVGYWGSYDVDEETNTLIHHVEEALDHAWAGTNLVRRYELRGNRLTLTFARGDCLLRTVYERMSSANNVIGVPL